MTSNLLLFLKGLAMGAANVIPGVSGGTIALITGIYEKLIHSVKSFDVGALRLLAKGDLKGLWERVNGTFLLMVFAGIALSILSIARLFKYIMASATGEMLLMAFFFGLILVSIYQVGQTVKKWSVGPILALIIGLAVAVGIALISPGQENEATWYLLLCGVIAMCSMILPGLSGSFVLIILGNYKLVMVDAVSDLNLGILIPVAIGAVIGLIAFSQVLSWVFKHYHDLTISLMTGFIIGSLLIIWPWKDTLRETIKGKEKIVGYDNWHLPDFGEPTTYYALGLILLGGLVIWGMGRLAGKTS
jgi:putative membrane protein